MRPVPGFEETNWYGQVEVGPESGTYPEGSDYTLWRRATDANNNPSVGAVAFEGATSKTRWYLGLEGSSFVGTYDGISKTCEYSGIITQGKSHVTSMTSSKGNKEPGMMSSKSSKATTTTSTATPAPIELELVTTYEGGSSDPGFFFDIDVVNKVNIRGNAGDSVPIQVYYHLGSYKGFEENAGAWTKLVDTTVTSVGEGAGTMIEFPTPISLSGGSTTHSFFVVRTDASGPYPYPYLIYTRGVDSTEGNVYTQDANIIFKVGRRAACDPVNLGPFCNDHDAPYIWNGAFVYYLV